MISQEAAAQAVSFFQLPARQIGDTTFCRGENVKDAERKHQHENCINDRRK